MRVFLLFFKASTTSTNNYEQLTFTNITMAWVIGLLLILHLFLFFYNFFIIKWRNKKYQTKNIKFDKLKTLKKWNKNKNKKSKTKINQTFNKNKATCIQASTLFIQQVQIGITQVPNIFFKHLFSLLSAAPLLWRHHHHQLSKTPPY